MLHTSTHLCVRVDYGVSRAIFHGGIYLIHHVDRRAHYERRIRNVIQFTRYFGFFNFRWWIDPYHFQTFLLQRNSDRLIVSSLIRTAYFTRFARV